MQEKLQTSVSENMEVVQLKQNLMVNAPADFIYDNSDYDLKAYDEAVLVIYKFQGEIRAKASGHRTVVETQLPTVRLSVGPLNFGDLARRISSQLQEVASTSKDITAATRRMSDGVQELNKGVGTMKQKLTRMKY